MKTTAKVTKLGIYKSRCCSDETLFDRNDCFTRCPRCERLCSWEFVEPVISWVELNELEQAA